MGTSQLNNRCGLRQSLIHTHTGLSFPFVFFFFCGLVQTFKDLAKSAAVLDSTTGELSWGEVHNVLKYCMIVVVMH